MSSTDYAAKLAVIEAINHNNTKKLNIPVKAYLQEAENLYHWVQDLPQRIGA